MKNYIRRTGVTLLLGIFLLPALTPSVQPQTPPLWYYGCPQGSISQVPGNIPNPGTTGWAQYQSYFQQRLSVSPQQSAQIVPILANEGQKIIATRNNNSLSDIQKIQEITSFQKQSDPQLKSILSSAQYDKLKVVRYQAVRWSLRKDSVGSKEEGLWIRSRNPSPAVHRIHEYPQSNKQNERVLPKTAFAASSADAL